MQVRFHLSYVISLSAACDSPSLQDRFLFTCFVNNLSFNCLSFASSRLCRDFCGLVIVSSWSLHAFVWSRRWYGARHGLAGLEQGSPSGWGRGRVSWLLLRTVSLDLGHAEGCLVALRSLALLAGSSLWGPCLGASPERSPLIWASGKPILE